MESTNQETKRSGFCWWPHYVGITAVVMVVVTVMIAVLATLYPVPDDAPNEIPLPDFGENVPGPEWLFLLFWAPFWYLVGTTKKFLVFMPLVPIIGAMVLVALPYFHKIPLGRLPGLAPLLAKCRDLRGGMVKSFVYAIPALFIAVTLSVATVANGRQAKVLGCDSCHNRAMGHRMAVPPEDVARYYEVERAMQIGVGKYRAGKSDGVDAAGNAVYTDVGGEEGGYKNANWQMRHMYEPTFTW